jgi:hypothetical protein
LQLKLLLCFSKKVGMFLRAAVGDMLVFLVDVSLYWEHGVSLGAVKTVRF